MKKQSARVYNKYQTRFNVCESACTGVTFTDADPTGAVAGLVRALTFVTRDVHCDFSEDREIISAARAALARVRIADGGDGNVERSHRAVLRESEIVDGGDTEQEQG